MEQNRAEEIRFGKHSWRLVSPGEKTGETHSEGSGGGLAKQSSKSKANAGKSRQRSKSYTNKIIVTGHPREDGI